MADVFRPLQLVLMPVPRLLQGPLPTVASKWTAVYASTLGHRSLCGHWVQAEGNVPPASMHLRTSFAPQAQPVDLPTTTIEPLATLIPKAHEGVSYTLSFRKRGNPYTNRVEHIERHEPSIAKYLSEQPILPSQSTSLLGHTRCKSLERRIRTSKQTIANRIVHQGPGHGTEDKVSATHIHCAIDLTTELPQRPYISLFGV